MSGKGIGGKRGGDDGVKTDVVRCRHYQTTAGSTRLGRTVCTTFWRTSADMTMSEADVRRSLAKSDNVCIGQSSPWKAHLTEASNRKGSPGS